MRDLIDRQAVDKIINDLLENDNLQASPSVWHGLHMIKQLPSAQPELHYCRECKWSRCRINVDKHGKTKTYWRCLNWDGGTDEEGYCHEWERRTDE